MSNTLTEKKLLKELDIPNWKYMTKDKIIPFVSSMTCLDPEVAKAAINQFPNFVTMGNEIILNCRNYLEDINDKNDKQSERTYELNMKILDSLEKRLNKRFLLPGERKKIIEAMVEVSQNISELDKENKHFHLKLLNNLGHIALGMCAVGATIIGAKIKK